MKFLSYAQNFEDVILNRAFKGQDQGFYLDVGAAHPIGHSVTKNFYERGWHGINIEPGSAAFAMVVADRHRDVNLNVGISEAPGELTFYEAPDSLGISTFNDDWREKWQTRDGEHFVQKTVKVMTLTQVCELYVHQPIDFLKIDVEGHEPKVLAGADLYRWRPKVVCVEGDRELYQTKLIEANYLHATFDGVNHYFVAAEHSHLIPLLAQPVSLVMDNFELYETVCERIGHQSAVKHLGEARLRCDQLEFEMSKAREASQQSGSDVSSQELIEAIAIRDELEATLQETLTKLAELTNRHEVLRAKVAPLIEVKRALHKVDSVFGHPAHRFRMMSANLRQGSRSAAVRRD
jgi:FkbM family methyltransferase